MWCATPMARPHAAWSAMERAAGSPRSASERVRAKRIAGAGRATCPSQDLVEVVGRRRLIELRTKRWAARRTRADSQHGGWLRCQAALHKMLGDLVTGSNR